MYSLDVVITGQQQWVFEVLHSHHNQSFGHVQIQSGSSQHSSYGSSYPTCFVAEQPKPKLKGILVIRKFKCSQLIE